MLPKPEKYLIFRINLRAYFRNIQQKISNLNIPDYTTFSIYALIIGISAGFAAVLFHNSIEFFNKLFFNQTTEGFYFLGTAAVIVIPALGMFIQAIMIQLFRSQADKKGVAEVIKAVSIRGGFISFRTTVFNFFASVICIGSGGTLGPEGPAAQLGGGVASKFGSVLSLSDERRRIFTAAGAGAAIAAIFNTPLGGVFFAIEVILLNDFHTPTFSALIIASVAASAVSRTLLGNISVFQFEILENFDYSTIYFYAIIGIVCGLISTYFIKYSDSVKLIFKKKIYEKQKYPQIIVMIIVGLVVGFCGLYYKEIFGIGYSGINSILKSELTLTVVVILLVLKFVLVPLVYHSGGFGGFFAPALFMGACVGYITQFGLEHIFNITIQDDTVILVSMGAMLAGMNSIPIASILIIFEMTQNYNFILPLMLSVILCSMLVQISLRKSIHIKHLESEGFRLPGSNQNNILKNITIADVKLQRINTIDENKLLPEILSAFTENSEINCLYVINNENKLIGYISENEIRPIIAEFENLKLVLVAKDISNSNLVFVSRTDDLDFVMNQFSKHDIDQFPVIDSIDSPPIGCISKDDIIKLYSKESLKMNLADGFSKELKTINKATPSKVAEGFSVMELIVPRKFIGKNLAELKLRSNYGVEVLMIKKNAIDSGGAVKTEISIPNPELKLQIEDSLIVFGSDINLEKLRNN